MDILDDFSAAISARNLLHSQMVTSVQAEAQRADNFQYEVQRLSNIIMSMEEPRFTLRSAMKLGSGVDVSAAGLPKLLTIDEAELHPTSARGAPDETYLSTVLIPKLYARAPGATEIVLDLEAFWTNTVTLTEIGYYVAFVRFFKRYFRSVTVYSTIPDRQIDFLTGTKEENAIRLINWRATNDFRKPIADEVDFLCPSLYLLGKAASDATCRQQYFGMHIEECSRLAPGKPIIPYIWPIYHRSSPAPYANQLIAGDVWATMLQQLNGLVTSAAIWMGAGTVIDQNAGWWQETLKFIDQQKEARA